MTEPTVRNHFDRQRVAIDFTGQKTLTKQSHQKECDINNIMARYQKTGAIEHTAKHAPRYLDTTGIAFHDAELLVAGARSMFEELPSSLRATFDNSPQLFLDFVADPENDDELKKLGLTPADDKAAPAATQPPSDPPSTPESAENPPIGETGDPTGVT